MRFSKCFFLKKNWYCIDILHRGLPCVHVVLVKIVYNTVNKNMMYDVVPLVLIKHCVTLTAAYAVNRLSMSALIKKNSYMFAT